MAWAKVGLNHEGYQAACVQVDLLKIKEIINMSIKKTCIAHLSFTV